MKRRKIILLKTDCLIYKHWCIYNCDINCIECLIRDACINYLCKIHFFLHKLNQAYKILNN